MTVRLQDGEGATCTLQLRVRHWLPGLSETPSLLRPLPRRIIAPGLSQKNFDDYDMQFTKKVISESVSPMGWKPACLPLRV